MSNDPPAFWRIHCHIGHHPGQWQFWFREQCCAVGWPPSEWNGRKQDGWSIDARYPGEKDFTTTMNSLRRMRRDDWIVATLPGHRVGRLGRVVGLAVEDEDWNPIVRPTTAAGFGENGRRILVRWELTTGPADPSRVVLLPPSARFNAGEIRGTIRSIPIDRLDIVRDAMNDESNWVSLSAAFNLETALSGYIAVHPHRLEDGMIGYPSLPTTELRFPDGTRADVVLQDRDGRIVVVECKQGAPSEAALRQVDGYRQHLRDRLPDYQEPRAMIVHGGSRRVASAVAAEASRLNIELVYFELQVNFVDSHS